MSLRRALVSLVAAASVVCAQEAEAEGTQEATAQDFMGLGIDIKAVDVVIVGGGASGAHAAVRLHDKKKSYVLVEQLGQLVSGTLVRPLDMTRSANWFVPVRVGT